MHIHAAESNQPGVRERDSLYKSLQRRFPFFSTVNLNMLIFYFNVYILLFFIMDTTQIVRLLPKLYIYIYNQIYMKSACSCALCVYTERLRVCGKEKKTQAVSSSVRVWGLDMAWLLQKNWNGQMLPLSPVTYGSDSMITVRARIL